MRTITAALIGLLIGILVTLAGIGLTGGLYEYRVAIDANERADLINRHGYSIVPSQDWPSYLYRSRLSLSH